MVGEMRIKQRKLALKSELLRGLVIVASSVDDATNSSQCNACSCEQHCEQVRRGR